MLAVPAVSDGDGQHREDRRIGMVEADGADRREGAQIVFVGRVIAVPGHHVDRRMRQLGLEQRAAPFHVQFGRRVLVLIGRDRREEIARIGKAIGADRAALRQREGAAVILAEIAARGAAGNLDAEFHAARDHRDLAGLDVDPAELGDEAQIALLRHEHHLAVGIVEMLIDHRFGDEIDMRGHAGLACWRRRPSSWSARPAGRSCPPSGSASGPSAIARSASRCSWHGAVRHSPASTLAKRPECFTDGRMR